MTAYGGPRSPLGERLSAHLGADPAEVPVVAEEFPPYELPNVQVALDAVAADAQVELRGLAAPNKRFMALSFSDLVAGGIGEGPVDYVNVHLAGGETLACVRFGLYLITRGQARLAVFVTGPPEAGGPRSTIRIEAAAARTEDARSFLAAVSRAMEERNVYRGHVLSLEPGRGMGPSQSLVEFHDLHPVDRDEVVLPEGLLERIERHTLVFARHAGDLRAAGLSLRRGMLLHGPPGTGKTHTIRYLCGRMPGRTVFLVSGRGLGLLPAVASMARSLAPAMIVVEDVDLIAEERTMPTQRTAPLLFELLNQMDGLTDDTDIIFVLTTNRAELLEPALAARPGRIDVAVELPLPDTARRGALLQLYGRGLDLGAIDLDELATRIDGATPAYIRELLRKSALLALASGAGIALQRTHVTAALDDLATGGRLAERLVGFHPERAPHVEESGSDPAAPREGPRARGR